MKEHKNRPPRCQRHMQQEMMRVKVFMVHKHKRAARPCQAQNLQNLHSKLSCVAFQTASTVQPYHCIVLALESCCKSISAMRSQL
jgi:hypothetical protein